MRPQISRGPEETEEAGYRLAAGLEAGAVVSLIGPLGCGKTVFVKGMARALDVREPITSPTFLIIQEYSGRLPFYHMDLYRLRSANELEDIGLRDYLSAGGVTAIEWGDRALSVLPASRTEVRFSLLADGGREIRIQGAG